MDQSEAHAALKQDTEWTNRRHRQYLDKTELIDKPETHAVLKQDAEWTNQRNRQY